jgi:hypothetical protein
MPLFDIHIECFLPEYGRIQVEAATAKEALAIARELDLEEYEMKIDWDGVSMTRIYAVTKSGQEKEIISLKKQLAPFEAAHQSWLDASL